jgi:hypothetical protein
LPVKSPATRTEPVTKFDAVGVDDELPDGVVEADLACFQDRGEPDETGVQLGRPEQDAVVHCGRDSRDRRD